jgi:hypothetical protein
MPRPTEPSLAPQPPPLISAAPLRQTGERYALTRAIGRGGVAYVYEATEIATGRRLALKRLHAQSDTHKQQRNEQLFEREFHALSQLAHPRIVEVYDFGIDEAGPFYTMELLDGGDLQELAPLPWRTACAIARDVCSALSLLHSRRLVHRDVSPRNVRRTHAGLAKLLDFGAMAPIGPNKLVVGTPPCCAPESVNLQALDGRTDLYALGATLYYMLLGRHAYVARQFSLLHEAWQTGFTRPAALLPEIPEALDALILDLLRLEPDARPSSAAEVLQRLSAIDGESQTEQLGVAQAYLSLPTLVGREQQLSRVRRKLERSAGSRGATLVVEGLSGVGRTRFLDSCLLDATLLGLTTARADADDAFSGDYGVLRALARQLILVLPATALSTAQPFLPVLRQFIPELGEANAAEASAPSERATRPQLQAAVHGWLTALSRGKPLLIAVDDFQRIDEPSAALLSLLAHDTTGELCLLLSSESGAHCAYPLAHKLLLEHALHIPLENLTRDESEILLKSLFGEVPNSGSFAHSLHELAGGNPRDLMRLAQHLVDRQVVRYESGAWSVALRIDAADLPSSMAQALRTRLETLTDSALELASAFALCPDQGFVFEECNQLRDQPAAAQLLADLDELVRADVVRRADDRFMLSQARWAPALRAGLAADLESRLHARLAVVLENRAEPFRAGQHWLRAGDYPRALDVLVAHATESQERTARSAEEFSRYARALPADWCETFQRALTLCDVLARPKRDAFMLRGRLAGILPAFCIPDSGQLSMLLTQLKYYSGLDDYAALDPTLEPLTRLQTALQRATERDAAASAHDRVVDPSMARRMLLRAISAATGIVVASIDVENLRSLPVLSPFAPISPGLAVMGQLLEGIDARYTGRVERARQIYKEVLARVERADHGIDGSYAHITRLGVMNALGMMEACMGLDSSLVWAERAASHAEYQVNAVQTRMLYHLYQGDVRAADQCKKQVERLRLQSLQLYPGSHLLWELSAYSIAGDLTRMRYAIEELAPLAQRYPAWHAVRLFAAADYDRIRSDSAQSLDKIQQALALAKPGGHPLWSSMATTRVLALLDLGRAAEALGVAETYVATARRVGLAYMAEQLLLALGLCQAHVGNDAAKETIDAVITRFRAQDVGGVLLGLAYETRTRVALLRGDESDYAHYAGLCRELYCRHKNPALLAKYQRLHQDAEKTAGFVDGDASITPDSYASYTGVRIVAALEYCKGVEQRAKLALTILARQSGATAGFLFTLGATGFEMSAAVGGEEPSARLLECASEYLAEHMQLRADDTTFTDSAALPEASTAAATIIDAGRAYRPVLLSHNADSHVAVMGVAMLAVPASGEFKYPAQVAGAISRFWAECGYSSMLELRD